MTTEKIRGFPPLPDGMAVEFGRSMEDFRCQDCGAVASCLWRTSCQHRFCPRCVQSVFGDDRAATCPVDGRSLRRHQLTEDKSAMHTVPKEQVSCTYRRWGCRRKLIFHDLNVHREDCVYAPTKCPQKCGLEVPVKTLMSHMEKDCSKRLDHCIYCQDDLTLDVKEQHEASCPLKPKPCPYCRQGMFPEEELTDHLQTCPDRPRECMWAQLGCSFMGTGQEMRCHEDSWGIHVHFMTSLLAEQKRQYEELNEQREATEDIMIHMEKKNADLQKHLERLTLEVKGLQQDREVLQQQVTDLQIYKSAVKADVQVLKSGLKEVEKSTGLFPREKLEAKLKKYETKHREVPSWVSGKESTCTDGTYVWKLARFSVLYQKAVADLKASVRSQSFYLGNFGYHMCLEVELTSSDTEDKKEEPTSLGVYVTILKGEHDRSLDWPFRRQVKLAILDQTGEGAHVEETIDPVADGLTEEYFQKPQTERNASWGWPEFVPIAILLGPDSPYVRDDTVILKATCDVLGWQRRLEELEGGAFLWTVHPYSRLKLEAKREQRNMTYSPLFCTERYGYRMRLAVWLNGVGVGEGGHVSLGLEIVRGEYDALLDWPFTHQITLVLVDQTGEGNHLEATVNPVIVANNRYFRRPKSQSNDSYDLELFISHEQLEVQGGPFLQNDTLMLQVIVKPPSPQVTL